MPFPCPSRLTRHASARPRPRASPPAPGLPCGPRSSGSGNVAPAARACPPPPNAAGESVASTPPSRVRMLTRVVRRPRHLLEQDRHLGRSRAAPACRSGPPIRPRSRRSAADRPAPGSTTRACPRARDSMRARTRPKSTSWLFGLDAVQAPRDLAQRRTGLPQRGRHDQRPGRDVGVPEVGRVHDHAARQGRGQHPVPGVSGTPIRQRQQGHHLAGGRAARVDPVDRAEARVRQVVVDVEDRHALEQRRGASPEPGRSAPARRSRRRRAGRSRRPASGLLRGSGPCRRRNLYTSGIGSAQTGVATPPLASTSSAIARAEPSASASGFSWQIVRTRRAARSRSTISSGMAASVGRQIDRVGPARSSRPPPRLRLPGRPPAVAAVPPDRGRLGPALRGAARPPVVGRRLLERRPRAAGAAPAWAATPPRRSTSSGSLARLQLVEQLQDARAALRSCRPAERPARGCGAASSSSPGRGG